MPLRVRASAIAPDLRFGAAGALADPGALVVGSGVTIRAEGCLPHSTAVSRYLRYADRDAILVADGVDELGDLESCLSEQIHVAAVDDLGSAVIALDAVDRWFRESGLWRGNIYLAGVGALSAVLDLVQGAGSACRQPEAILRELAALELAYLFPIAGKFRSGAYDGQIQYRLNGWGRALAQRLTTTPSGAARASDFRRAIGRHLADEHQRYASFLPGLDVARQHYRDDQLDLALALPIPVLA
jgi:hypothetical protein